MSDTPTLPVPGSILAPILRNFLRYGAGFLLALAVTHGLLDPASAHSLLSHPAVEELLVGAAMALIGLAETLWIKARRSGSPT